MKLNNKTPAKKIESEYQEDEGKGVRRCTIPVTKVELDIYLNKTKSTRPSYQRWAHASRHFVIIVEEHLEVFHEKSQ
jgi:hypothetical protein